MVYRSWQIARPDPARRDALCAALELPRLVCGVLCARGLDTPEAARAVVCGEDAPFPDPMLLPGMAAAVERIHRAVDGGERIAVFGDYDVDGVTATALLYLYLDSVSADVYYKLPSREDDGYGLFPPAVEQMAAKGVQLIISVDNGISAHEAADAARALGVDLVVTDHHLPPQTLPKAAAVVDPQLPGSGEAYRGLSGAGVAFLLAAALEGCPPEELLPFYGDLAAVGTVADVMPLTGINRRIVREGLLLLQQTERPGIAALLEECSLADKPLTAENISFALAPRLNAAGRMDSATGALELLLCEDPDEAAQWARQLEQKNTARQKAEQEILQNVFDTLAADASYRTDRVLVVWGRGYHPGVIGIVASRVIERFGKPAIIISVDEKGEGRGSGRGTAGFSLYDAIAACSGLLVRFGGHAQAAGLSIREEQLPAFRRAVNAWAARSEPVPALSTLRIDLPVLLSELHAQDVQALSVLAPFGSGNPAPLFLIENAVIEAIAPLSEGKHSRVRLRQGPGVLYAALFGRTPEALGYRVGDAVDAAVSLSVYEGKNGPMLSARLRELRPAGLDEQCLEAAALYEAFLCGAPLTRAQRARLCPVRADTVALYRALAAVPDGVLADDLRPLFARLGAENAGKTLVSLEALRELGFAEVCETPHGARWRLTPCRKKKDLASAPVLRRLEAAQ